MRAGMLQIRPSPLSFLRSALPEALPGGCQKVPWKKVFWHVLALRVAGEDDSHVQSTQLDVVDRLVREGAIAPIARWSLPGSGR